MGGGVVRILFVHSDGCFLGWVSRFRIKQRTIGFSLMNQCAVEASAGYICADVTPFYNCILLHVRCMQ